MLMHLGKRWVTQIPHYTLTNKEFGNTDLIAQAGSHTAFLEQSLKYFQSDIFYYWQGSAKQIVLGHPRYYKAVSKLQDKSSFEGLVLGSVLGKNSITVAKQQEHLRMKQYIYNVFSSRNIKNSHYEAIWKVVNEWTLPQIQQSLNYENPLVSLNVALGTSFRVVIQTIFGINIINDSDRCNQCIQKVDQLWLMLENIQSEGPVKEGTEQFQKLLSANSKLNEFAQESLQLLDKDRQATLIAQSILQNQNLEEAYDQLKLLIIAGTHTVGHLLNWMFYFIAKYPDVQEKLHQELDSFEDLQSFESLSQLKYAKNIIYETLRYTYFFYIVTRVNDGHDIELPGGYVIEHGDAIYLFNKAVFYHPDYWIEPNTFNPDRFSDPRSRGIHFQPYGFQGKRVCPGSNLANVQTLLTIASIFKRYKVELDQNQKEVQMISKMNTKASDDILLRFSER